VPQDFADLIERGAVAEHIGREAVSQKVRAFARGYDTGFPQRTEHDLGDGRCVISRPLKTAHIIAE
jgi:hypothetical protein